MTMFLLIKIYDSITTITNTTSGNKAVKMKDTTEKIIMVDYVLSNEK